MFDVEISNAFAISNRGTVLSGRVRRGAIRVGDRALLKSPAGEVPTRVAGVEVHRKALDVAHEGDEAGVLCRDITAKNLEAHFVGDGEDRRLHQVFLISAQPRWWEFWRDYKRGKPPRLTTVRGGRRDSVEAFRGAVRAGTRSNAGAATPVADSASATPTRAAIRPTRWAITCRR